MTEKNSKPAGLGAGLIWLFVLSAIHTLFFMQALRDILISPGIEEEIMPLLLTLAIAPAAAILLTYVWKHSMSLAVGVVMAVAGRLLLFFQEVNIYYAAEMLSFAGFAFFFVGTVAHVNRRSLPEKYRRSGAALVAAGIVWAPAFHLLLRGLDATYLLPLNIALCVAASAAAFAGVFRRSENEEKRSPRGAPGFGPALKSSTIVLICAPLHFLFIVFGKPEILASRSAASYGLAAFAVAVGLGAACAIAVLWESAGERTRKTLGVSLLFGNIAAAAYFYFLFDAYKWPLAAAVVAAAVVGLDLYRIVAYSVAQRAGWLTLAAGVAAAGASIATFGVDAGFLLEHHFPPFHGYAMLPLVVFSLLTVVSLAKEEKEETVSVYPPVWAVAAIALVPALGFLIFFGAKSIRGTENRSFEPLVFASLYTWYGTPDGVLGRTFPGYKFEKEGGRYDFAIDTANMPAVMAGGNGPGLFKAGGTSDGKKMNLFVIGFDMPAALLNSSPKTFITMRYEVNRPPNRLLLEITTGGKVYRAEMPKPTKMSTYRFDWPDWFASAPAERKVADDMAHVSIYVKGNEAALYTITFDYFRISRWTHYNEDYRTYFDKGKKVWYNDPPETLATAHRVYYDGEPWRLIAPYSPHGYYDSLDPNVMKSQLMLMAQAGIDVVLFMHPPMPEVIRQGMDIIRSNRLPLRVSWYWDGEDEAELIRDIKPLAADPLFLKVDGRPVVVLGKTGLRRLPYAKYVRKFGNLRRAGIFVVGDNYAPPKEEMLSLMDGHYYYDTTGLYRARWGSPKIRFAKPDGTFMTGYGHLFTIFDAISRITHGHDGVFLATVIPGFNNLAVHGFKGTPLYDERPGTVVERQNGETYAETWQAAIDSRADWVCIVSWNELHEGTEIEPTMEDGVKYVELTRVWSDRFRAAHTGE